MVIINISNTLILTLLTIATGLIVYLGRETKKSIIPGTMLVVYLVLLITYAVQMIINGGRDLDISRVLSNCLMVDFIFIFIAFFGYLWVDDIEAKAKNKKSVSNDLEWLWRKI